MASRGGTTTDHAAIRHWAEARGAHPSRIVRTGAEDPADEAGIIRLDLPGHTGAGPLEPISWDEWFRAFDDNGLAFVYEDTAADGEPSNYDRLVKRATATARGTGGGRVTAEATNTSRRGGRKGGARTDAGASAAKGARTSPGRGANKPGTRTPAGAGTAGSAGSRASQAASNVTSKAMSKAGPKAVIGGATKPEPKRGGRSGARGGSRAQ